MENHVKFGPSYVAEVGFCHLLFRKLQHAPVAHLFGFFAPSAIFSAHGARAHTGKSPANNSPPLPVVVSLHTNFLLFGGTELASSMAHDTPSTGLGSEVAIVWSVFSAIVSSWRFVTTLPMLSILISCHGKKSFPFYVKFHLLNLLCISLTCFSALHPLPNDKILDWSNWNK